MFRSLRRSSSTAFTLVEMLVVIGIIAVLAALLLPAVTAAITRARNAAIAMEVKQIENAIESYRLEKGDYPPNFRDRSVVMRHLMKCYPRINPTYADTFATYACSQTNVGSAPILFIDEGESLVFWLSMTDSNPQYPFLSYFNPSALIPNPKKYYDFDQTRLVSTNTTESGPVTGAGTFTALPSFQAKYCKETYYIYIESRSYDNLTVNFTATPPANQVYAYAEDTTAGVRPYWSTALNTSNPLATLPLLKFNPANPTTFQVICAGQDGDFGYLASDTTVKTFPTGSFYNDGDKDNITNFSSGKTLGDSIP